MIFHPSFYLGPDFVMAIQTNTPSDVSDATKAHIFETLDVDLNVPILESLLQGVLVFCPGRSI